MNRIAVSLLLTPSFESDRVYLVRRNEALKFFGGYWAFPGGTLEPEDQEVPVVNLHEPSGDRGRDYGAFIAAAARELFEETGVWLAGGEACLSSSELDAYRLRLLRGDICFLEILKETNQSVDAREFTSVCRITTPPFGIRRYDTWFLRCRLPSEITPEVWPGELVEGHLTSAGEALQRWRRGELLIAPPVVIILKELAGRDCESFLPAVRNLTDSYDRGKLHRVYFSCGVILAPLKTKTHPPATHTNAYIVGNRELYVVDPGSDDPAELKKLVELLDELIEEGKKLKGLLLTHHHPDHIGAVAMCLQRYRLPLMASKLTAALLTQFHFDTLLEHGQALDLGDSPDGRPGWKLRIYHVPGHTHGHLAFQETRYDAVVVGDLISTISSIMIDPEEGHMSTYLASLRFLEQVTSGTLYPGHGPATRDGRAAIRRAIEHRHQREQKILSSLDGKPQSLESLFEKVYEDVDPRAASMARRSLRAGLIKLREEGRISATSAGFAIRAGL